MMLFLACLLGRKEVLQAGERDRYLPWALWGCGGLGSAAGSSDPLLFLPFRRYSGDTATLCSHLSCAPGAPGEPCPASALGNRVGRCHG